MQNRNAAVLNPAIADNNESLENKSALLHIKIPFISQSSIFSLIWLIGMISFTLYTLIVYFIFVSKINRQHKCTDATVIEILNKCKQKMNIKTSITVIYSRTVKSPCLLGLIKPKLILPKKIIAQLSDDEMKYIFFHELGHLKRNDIFINWITTILQSIHWFNPLIWISFHKMKQDCELSCDIMTLKHISPSEYRNYGETLIKLINIISKPKCEPLTEGILSGTQIKRRIIMISKHKKKKFLLPIVAIIITLAVCVSVLTNAKEKILNSGKPSVNNTIANTNNGTSSQTSDNTDQTGTTNSETANNSNAAANSAANNKSAYAITNSANYAQNKTSNTVSNNSTKNAASSDSDIAEKTKDYIINGQGNLSDAQRLNWSETFLNQVDINSLYKQYLAKGGQTGSVENFASYITLNAPVQSNWKELFGKDLYAQYKEKFTKLEPLGDNLYQAYIIKNGSEIPFVVVSSRTGYYHG